MEVCVPNDDVYKLEQFGDKSQQDGDEEKLAAAADALRDISREHKQLMPEVIVEAQKLALLGNGDFTEGLRPDPSVVVAGRLVSAEDAEDGPKLLPPAPERKSPKKRPRRRETATERKQKQVTRIRHHAQRSKQSFSRR